MSNQLVAKSITKSYSKRSILRGISLYLNTGEVVGLFGPNGAGKTTCFSIIAGLQRSDSGQILLDDRDITYCPMYLRAKMGIGYLPQEASVFRGLSVFDNLKAVIEIMEHNDNIVEQIANDLLLEFSISHLKHVSSLSLSGGERRRLEIARAIACKPKFIMLDEPLAGIDPLAIIDIKHLIKLLTKRNIGVLITDHNVRDTLDIVNRAYVIYDGQVLIEGTANEITNSDRVREVYLGHHFNM